MIQSVPSVSGKSELGAAPVAMTHRESVVRSADQREIESSDAATPHMFPVESLTRFAPSKFPITTPVEGTPANVQISEPAETAYGVGVGVGVGVVEGVGVGVGVGVEVGLGVGVGVGSCPRAGRAKAEAVSAIRRRRREELMRVTSGIVAAPDARSVPRLGSRKVGGLTRPRCLA